MKFENGSKVVIKGIGKMDGHYGRKKELVGKVATVEELHETGGGFLGGSLTVKGGGTFYFWKVKVRREKDNAK